jgi:RimJ/RimL family protein N-acetyltransferase
MSLSVREMAESEVDLIIDYFHGSTLDHLELIGVDPVLLPQREAWRAYYALVFQQPLEQRETLLLTWLDDERPVGFSTADKIAFGDQAHMHLHVTAPSDRRRGLGVEAVRRSVDLYFERLRLKRLFCEPHAFNAAPNRTLRSAGFRYLKTHVTVPGPLNFRQPVARWVISRPEKLDA